MLYAHEKSILRKTPVIPIAKFLSHVLPRNATMLQYLIIQFLPCCLSSGHLQEVKKRKISNPKLKKWSQSLSRGVRLQEVLNIVIWLGNFWYFGKLVIDERWLQPTRGSNVLSELIPGIPFFFLIFYFLTIY